MRRSFRARVACLAPAIAVGKHGVAQWAQLCAPPGRRRRPTLRSAALGCRHAPLESAALLSLVSEPDATGDQLHEAY
eukprot:scaffold1006_cov270-Pinguiococcus_pyrenoidosus.AAC.15